MEYQKDIIGIMIGFLVSLGIICLLVLVSKEKAKSHRRLIWGIGILFPLSFVLSITIGLTYALIKQQKLAFILGIYVFPIIFIIGLIYTFSGVAMILDERGRRKYRKEGNLYNNKD